MTIAWSWHAPPAQAALARHWRVRGWLARWAAFVRLTPDAAGHGDEGTPPRDGVTRAGQPARALGPSDFEAFFLRYERQITGYLWRLTGDEQSASELTQETFLRAWQHFDAVRHYEQPLAWLFRVATNLARQQHRRTRAPVGRATPLDDEADLASSDPTLRVAERELVRDTLLHLSFQQRAALILFEVEDLSCAEVGELLHLSRGAVKMALWRAREQFRVRYLRESEEPQ